jgi:hypothetical protein
MDTAQKAIMAKVLKELMETKGQTLKSAAIAMQATHAVVEGSLKSYITEEVGTPIKESTPQTFESSADEVHEQELTLDDFDTGTLNLLNMGSKLNLTHAQSIHRIVAKAKELTEVQTVGADKKTTEVGANSMVINKGFEDKKPEASAVAPASAEPSQTPKAHG